MGGLNKRLTLLTTLLCLNLFIPRTNAEVIYFRDGSILPLHNKTINIPKVSIIDIQRNQTRLKDGSVLQSLPENLPSSLDLEKITMIDLENNFCYSIHEEFIHLGDTTKSIFMPPEPIGTSWETTFYIEDLNKIPEEVNLALEVMLAKTENPIYLNGQQIGFVPHKPKKEWIRDLKKYRGATPFLYKEIPISYSLLKQGENTIKINSNEKGKSLLGKPKYEDFTIRYLRLVK